MEKQITLSLNEYNKLQKELERQKESLREVLKVKNVIANIEYKKEPLLSADMWHFLSGPSRFKKDFIGEMFPRSLKLNSDEVDCVTAESHNSVVEKMAHSLSAAEDEIRRLEDLAHSWSAFGKYEDPVELAKRNCELIERKNERIEKLKEEVDKLKEAHKNTTLVDRVKFLLTGEF